jgi:hypothetical protein
MTPVLVRKMEPLLVGFEFVGLGCVADDVVKGVRTGTRPRQRGATTFSRTRIGTAMMLGCITSVL